jgi:hypothetical protein
LIRQMQEEMKQMKDELFILREERGRLEIKVAFLEEQNDELTRIVSSPLIPSLSSAGPLQSPRSPACSATPSSRSGALTPNFQPVQVVNQSQAPLPSSTHKRDYTRPSSSSVLHMETDKDISNEVDARH